MSANRKLAELKGVAASIPNKGILIGSPGLQEAKESSAIENIVTTQDELFRDDAADSPGTAAAKEVRLYATALRSRLAPYPGQHLAPLRRSWNGSMGAVGDMAAFGLGERIPAQHRKLSVCRGERNDRAIGFRYLQSCNGIVGLNARSGASDLWDLRG